MVSKALRVEYGRLTKGIQDADGCSGIGFIRPYGDELLTPIATRRLQNKDGRPPVKGRPSRGAG